MYTGITTTQREEVNMEHLLEALGTFFTGLAALILAIAALTDRTRKRKRRRKK